MHRALGKERVRRIRNFWKFKLRRFLGKMKNSEGFFANLHHQNQAFIENRGMRSS